LTIPSISRNSARGATSSKFISSRYILYLRSTIDDRSLNVNSDKYYTYFGDTGMRTVTFFSLISRSRVCGGPNVGFATA
jgi:hypothetical protein